MGCRFDGSVAEVPIELLETFTISVDIHADDPPETGTEVILGQPVPGTDNNIWQFIDNRGGNNISFSPFDIGVGETGNITVPLHRDTTYTIVLHRLGDRAFIAVTGMSPQFAHTCFSDGEIETNDSMVTIGGDRNAGGLTNFFHGHLRNIRFYSPALSNAQLLELHGTLDAEDLEFTCP